ncbi:MAG: hypothetical protein WAV21_01425 [Minisyncoccia bacterium]
MREIISWSVDPRIARSKEDVLVIAEIYYRMPDYPSILQAYIWQELDVPPEYRELHGFLDFWDENLEGKIYSVKIANRYLVKPGELRIRRKLRIHTEFRLH